MATAYRPTSSNKRIAVELDDAEQMPNGTTSLFQRSVGAEVTPTPIMLQDLPTELVEDILVKAVVAEVKGRKETKSTWKQDARRAVNRLSSVCPRWSDILATMHFQLLLQRNLGPSPLYLEIVAKHRIDSAVAVTTMNNEIFVLSHDEHFALNHHASVTVYDRNDLWRVKCVIHLGSFYKRMPTDIAACSQANCLYLISHESFVAGPSIHAIEKKSEFEYTTSLWKSLDEETTAPKLAVSAKESLVVTETGHLRCILEYKINRERGLQRVVDLPADDFLSLSKAAQKSNGNFVFESFQGDHARRLLEVDTMGKTVQRCRLPLCEAPCYAVGMHDRIMIAGPHNMMRMLDAQFQRIQVFVPGDLWNDPTGLHYDQAANEWMLIDDRKYLTVVTLKQRH